MTVTKTRKSLKRADPPPPAAPARAKSCRQPAPSRKPPGPAPATVTKRQRTAPLGPAAARAAEEEADYIVTNSSLSGVAGFREGLVFMGTADPMEWVTGIRKLLEEQLGFPPSGFESTHYLLKTTGGRQDLLFVFTPEAAKHISKLCLWRLEFGAVSWLSDYAVNYSSQHK